MITYIATAIIILTSIIGVTEIFRLIEHRILTGKERPQLVSVIPLKGHVEKAEYLLRGVANEALWENHAHDNIVVIDMGMDEETREICAMLAEELKCLTVCQKEELPTVIEHKTNLQAV